MSEITNKGYEIRVIKSAKNAAHIVTEAQVIPDKGEFKGRKFFTLQLQAMKQMVNGVMSRPQKKSITYNVFNSSDQQILFNDIEDVLQDAANYTTAANGAIIIKPSAMGIIGTMIDAPTGFVYDLMNKVGDTFVPLKVKVLQKDGSVKEETATRDFVRFFLHEEENVEIRIMQEIKKVKQFGHFANANNVDINSTDDSNIEVA